MTENKAWNVNEKLNIEELKKLIKPQNEVLKEGIYNFEVVDAKMAIRNSSAKLPACQEIVVTLDFSDENSHTKVFERLPLCDSMTWKFLRFFFCFYNENDYPILTPTEFAVNVVHKTGVAKLKITEYENKGNFYKKNEVADFLKCGGDLNELLQ